MNLSLISLREFLKQKKLNTYHILNKDDTLLSFQEQLTDYHNKVKIAIDKKESEEHFKSLLNDFLKDSYRYNVNTHRRIDSVIKVNENLKTIIEIKRPQNSNEYITVENINSKAFHEILLYYYELRQENLHTVNNIIITDCQTLYIFDSKEFESIINTKAISTLLNGYKNKELSIINTTTDFYNEVSKLIQGSDLSLEACKIDLFDENIDIEDLYRVLDEYHLLGKSLENKDHNVLDKDFYNELLYIMGLHEVVENNMPVIKPLVLSSVNNNNLITMIIKLIEIAKGNGQIDNKLWNKLGDDDDERYFSISLELILTWVNRILFLKLLEAQLINYHQDTDTKDLYKFLTFDANKLSTWDDIDRLFFEVLAKPLDDPNRSNKEIPYLNSALFEKTEYEKIISVSSLNDTDKLDVSKDSVLSNKTAKPVLQYLLEFLDCYHFGRGDDQVSESKRLINASVLGLIFEKLNGYKDGAVYTPSFITMSMSHESLRKTVVQKFNDTYHWSCKDFDELRNKVKREDDLLALNKTFNSIKICDPAVGSGHFLVSVLNELLLIKYELKILCDKHGEPISRCDMEIISDELLIKYGGKDFAYRVDKNNKVIAEDIQTIQETLFHEKERLIEGCLFGVDINPKSAYICQLRLWIELLKNTYYIQPTSLDSKIEDLQTLPNIDINIKTGNSLISRFSLKQDFSAMISGLAKQNITVKKYRELVNLYKNIHDKQEKQKIKQEINRIKTKFRNTFLTNEAEYEKLHSKYRKAKSELENIEYTIGVTTEQIEQAQLNFDKAEQALEKVDSTYINSMEWVYEFPEVLDDDGKFLGFDLVIGNPPYFRYNKQSASHISQLNHFKNHDMYSVACVGKINAYEVFLLLSYQLCKDNGFISEIFQHSFLGDTASKGVRKFYIENTNILHINAFPERDNHKKRVFENVKMSVMTMLVQKTGSTTHIPMHIYSDRMESDPKKIDINIDIIKMIDSESMEIPNLNEQELSIFAKCYQGNILLDQITDVYEGELNLTFCKKYFTDDDSKTYFLVGANVQKYYITNTPSQRTVPLYFDKEAYHKENTGTKSLHYQYERIIYQGITGVDDKYRLIANIISNEYCANTIDYLLLKEECSIDKVYLLGLMNSWLLNWLFKARSTNAHTNTYEIARLPIVDATPEQQAPIIDLVKKCMDAKAQDKNADISNYQKQIDLLVYALYGLSDSEVKVIEG
ncbi:MAG: DUF7149 domain-containing protein [Brevinema sp.]